MARQSKNELVKCEYCGEMYSVTYKHCPFCNEDGTGRWDDPAGLDDYYDDELPARGGRRLASSSRSRGEGPSVGRIIGWVLSLALIIAAAGIVMSIGRSLLNFGGNKDPKPVESQPVTESSTPAPSQPLPTLPPANQTTEPSQPPAPGPDVPSVDLTAPTDFKLRKTDISFFAEGEKAQMQVILTPADAHAAVAWSSSNPAVATVSETGLVTGVGRGTADITATIEGVGQRTCIVRCRFQTGGTDTPAAENTLTPSGSGSLKLSRDDFTLSKAGESWRLEVSGTSSPVTWASTDSAVATVSGDGTVTAVAPGTCRVTATVDGVTLKCIVRCTF